MVSIYSQANRWKSLLSDLLLITEPRCYFCGIIITNKSLYRKLSGMKKDEITFHHKDYNRENNTKENKVICHRKCHMKHHRDKELNDWNEARNKGD
jgi:hypothetical protein